MFPKNHHHPPLLNLDLQRERQPHEHFLFPLAIKTCRSIAAILLFILAFHTPSLKSNFMIFWREFLIPKEKASLLPIIFAPSGRMIRRQRGTRTSPVESLVSLLTFLSITSTFALDARLSGRLLVYPWAPTVHLCWLISSFIPLSTILWSKQ